jgi:hypothetical protein
VTSGDPTNVARCGYCGREFDVRRFLVRRLGSRNVYDSTECAGLDEVVEPRSVKRRRGIAPEAPLKAL